MNDYWIIFYGSRRQMDANELLRLLPPVLLGFGGILPFLVTSTTSLVGDASKALLSTILVLIIWIGYWAAMMFWRLLLFSDELVLALLTGSLIILVWIFVGAQQTTVPESLPVKDPTTPIQRMIQLSRRAIRRVFPPMPQGRPLYLSLYGVALLILSVAAAVYVAPKDKVILEVLGPIAITHAEFNIQSLNSASPAAFHQGKDGVSLLLSDEDFRDTKAIYFHSPQRMWTLEFPISGKKMSPGLGRRFGATAIPNN